MSLRGCGRHTNPRRTARRSRRSPVQVRIARSSAHGVDLRCRVRAIAQVDRGQAEIGPVNDRLIEPLQQDDEGIGGRSFPCPRTRPGKSSGDAPTSAVPIAVLRLIMVLLSISSPFPCLPAPVGAGPLLQRGRGLGVARATATVAGLPQRDVGATRPAERPTLRPCARCVKHCPAPWARRRPRGRAGAAPQLVSDLHGFRSVQGFR
jgi:hypothetical protein